MQLTNLKWTYFTPSHEVTQITKTLESSANDQLEETVYLAHETGQKPFMRMKVRFKLYWNILLNSVRYRINSGRRVAWDQVGEANPNFLDKSITTLFWNFTVLLKKFWIILVWIQSLVAKTKNIFKEFLVKALKSRTSLAFDHCYTPAIPWRAG